MELPTLCGLQLCSVSRSSACNKSGLYNTECVSGCTTDIYTFLSSFISAFSLHFFLPSFHLSRLSLLLRASLSFIVPFLRVVSFFHCQFLCFILKPVISSISFFPFLTISPFMNSSLATCASSLDHPRQFNLQNYDSDICITFSR